MQQLRGAKTVKVIEYMRKHPDAPRRQIAEAAGCTVARVGEIVRAGGINYDPHLAVLQKQSKPIEQPQTRSGRCEHEKANKTKTGSCKVCPPVA